MFTTLDNLKAINLQESVDKGARASTFQSLHDTAVLLSTFSDEAGPLAKMLEISREHSEHTQPIIDLLNQLKSKLLQEQEIIRTAASTTKAAHETAAAAATASCQPVTAKKNEMTGSESALTSAIAARDAADKEHKDLEAVWQSAMKECDAVAQKLDAEMRSLNSLERCAISAPKPFRSCYDIFADNSKAPSGVYKIDPTGNGTASLSVFCDMVSNGGGWTLLSSHDATGGYFGDTMSALSIGSVSADGPTSLYSILGLVDSFKRDDKFVFRYNSKATKNGPVDTWVIASQASSPLQNDRAGGCAADWKILENNYDVGSSQKLFCGWTPGPSGWAAINGYGPNWTHAVGQFKVYSDWPLVCTYNTNYQCSKVQFWVR